jgi:hypothetical protein
LVGAACRDALPDCDRVVLRKRVAASDYDRVIGGDRVVAEREAVVAGNRIWIADRVAASTVDNVTRSERAGIRADNNVAGTHRRRIGTVHARALSNCDAVGRCCARDGIAPKGVLSAAFAMPPSMATLFTPAALVN